MSAAASLEELEARCEVLSKRVTDRAPLRSPPRQHLPALDAAVQSSHDDYHNTSSSTGAILTAQDISTAVASLEREKIRLEEQLRLVNTHLTAYRLVMHHQSPQSPLAPNLVSANQPRSSPSLPSPTVSQHQNTPAPRNYSASLSVPSNEVQRLPPPPSNEQAGRPSLSQTEHIYEELKLIRKQREEREAARHAQLQAQVGSSSSTSFRPPSAAQRY